MNHIDEKLQKIREEFRKKFVCDLEPHNNCDHLLTEVTGSDEIIDFYESHIRRLLEEQEKELFEAQNLIAELWVRILTSILPHESTQTLDFIEDKLEAYVTSIASTTDKLHVSK